MLIPIQNRKNVIAWLREAARPACSLSAWSILTLTLTLIWLLPCFTLTPGNPSALIDFLVGHNGQIKRGIRGKKNCSPPPQHVVRNSFSHIILSFSLIVVQTWVSLVVEMSEPWWFNDQQMRSGCYRCSQEDKKDVRLKLNKPNSSTDFLVSGSLAGFARLSVTGPRLLEWCCLLIHARSRANRWLHWRLQNLKSHRTQSCSCCKEKPRH